MKNKKNAKLVRLASVIEKDRVFAGEDFKNIACKDLERTLSEYADLCGEMVFEVKKEGSYFVLEIKAKATRLKNFISAF